MLVCRWFACIWFEVLAQSTSSSYSMILFSTRRNRTLKHSYEKLSLSYITYTFWIVSHDHFSCRCRCLLFVGSNQLWSDCQIKPVAGTVWEHFLCPVYPLPGWATVLLLSGLTVALLHQSNFNITVRVLSVGGITDEISRSLHGPFGDSRAQCVCPGYCWREGSGRVVTSMIWTWKSLGKSRTQLKVVCEQGTLTGGLGIQLWLVGLLSQFLGFSLAFLNFLFFFFSFFSSAVNEPWVLFLWYLNRYSCWWE